MQYSTYCTLASKPVGTSFPLPTLTTLTERVEDLLDYDFASPSLCHDALIGGKKQARLAKLPSLPDFGGEEFLVAAAKRCGIYGLFKTTKRGGCVSDEQLAMTVKALLGAVMEDGGDENEVLRIAFSLGLEEAEEGVERAAEAGQQGEMGGDLLGVEEYRFVGAVASVPVGQSLI